MISPQPRFVDQPCSFESLQCFLLFCQSWVFFLLAAQFLLVWCERTAPKLRQTPYLGEEAGRSFLASRLSRDQHLVWKRPFGLRQKVVYAVALRHIRAVLTIRHFPNIGFQVLRGNPMVSAMILALEESPEAFDGIGRMSIVGDVLAHAMVHRLVVVFVLEPRVGARFVCDQNRAGRDMGANDSPQGAPVDALDHTRTDLSVLLDDTHDECLANGAASLMLALRRVFILFPPTDGRFIDSDHTGKRRVEALGQGGMAKAMQHEPSRLLGNSKVGRERRAGDALWVRRDHPDRRIPSAKGKLCILKNGPDADAETLTADVALVHVCAGQRANSGRFRISAQRAELALSPTDCREMIDGGLFGREGREQLRKGFEGREH